MKLRRSWALSTVLWLSMVAPSWPQTTSKPVAPIRRWTPSSGLIPEAKRETAPGFSLRDAEGNSVTLAQYRGKIVLLDFWTTWAVVARIHMPWFDEFSRRFQERGFEVVGVSLDDEGWSAVKPFWTASNYRYRVLLADKKVDEAYGVDSLPTAFLLDRAGRVAAVHIGLQDKEDFENEIKAMLGIQNGAFVGGSAADAVPN